MAIEENSAEDIRTAAKEMLAIGYKAENIRDKVNGQVKAAYLEADSKERIRLRDAMNKAYKALGYTEEDAGKTVRGWKAD